MSKLHLLRRNLISLTLISMPDYNYPNQVRQQPQPYPSQHMGIQPPKAPITQPPAAVLPEENNNKKIIAVTVSAVLIVVVIGAAFFITRRENKSEGDFQAGQTTQLANSQSGNFNLNSPQSSPIPAPLQNPDNFYTSTQFGISLTGPENWEKIEGFAGSIVTFRSAEIEIGDNNVELAPNLNLVVDTALTTNSLDAYAKQANAQRALSLQNYNLLGSAKETLGGQIAQIDDFTSTFGSIDLRQRQVYTIKGDGAYLFTFTATNNSWDKLLPTFDNVRNSFSFNGIVSGARTGF